MMKIIKKEGISIGVKNNLTREGKEHIEGIMGIDKEKVERRLVALHLTKKELADKLDMTRANLYKSLDNPNITLKRIEEIAQALDMEPRDLLK